MKPSENASRRFEELDSLRGVAALTVVFHHFSLITSPAAQRFLDHSPLRLIVAGHQAVVLFFILSGFVLFLPYARHTNVGYNPFLIKRLCRIYLPYLAALALAIMADASLPAYRSQVGWVNYTWTAPITVGLVVQHVLFIGFYHWTQFNTAFWSLVYEMRISLIFPALALAILRVRTLWTILSATGLSAAAFLLMSTMPSRLGPRHIDVSNAVGTLHYAVFFLLGALLAKNLHKVHRWYEDLSPAWAGGVAVVAVLFYCCSSPLRAMGAISQEALNLYDWGTAFGALLVIILAMNCGPFHRLLRKPVLMHLGTVSYSLYLVHGTVLFALIHTCLGHVPLLLILVLYLAFSFVLTEFFYRFVERPTQRLGRHLTARRRPKYQVVISEEQPVRI